MKWVSPWQRHRDDYDGVRISIYGRSCDVHRREIESLRDEVNRLMSRRQDESRRRDAFKAKSVACRKEIDADRKAIEKAKT